MTPKQIGFEGFFQICSTNGKKHIIKFAQCNKFEDFSKSKNYNINGKVKNTFIWLEKQDSELIYRNEDGKLFRVNFSPI